MSHGLTAQELDDFFSFDPDPQAAAKKAQEEKEQKEREKAEQKKKPDLPDAPAAYNRGVERHFTKRYKSEAALAEALDWHFEEGCSYHCISHGNVDSLSYLMHVLRQQKLKYCIVSTWCMAMTDAEMFHKWLKDGLIGRIDFYCGEIFTGSYGMIYQFILNECLTEGARCAIARNHSKVMVCFGERFDCVIESSANIDTNPRIEQSTVTVSTELATFYKDFFDGIVPYNRDACKGFKPYGVPTEPVHGE